MVIDLWDKSFAYVYDSLYGVQLELVDKLFTLDSVSLGDLGFMSVSNCHQEYIQ